MSKKKVLVTGLNGVVGSAIRPLFEENSKKSYTGHTKKAQNPDVFCQIVFRICLYNSKSACLTRYQSLPNSWVSGMAAARPPEILF